MRTLDTVLTADTTLPVAPVTNISLKKMKARQQNRRPLASMLISGHSAVMLQGQAVPALTAEPITVQ
ncbi:MAG TPA: hypothetical protein VF409_05265 [Sphingomonas sp.]